MVWRAFGRTPTGNDGERRRRGRHGLDGFKNRSILTLRMQSNLGEPGVSVMGPAVIDGSVDMEKTGWLGRLPVILGQVVGSSQLSDRF